MEAVYFLGIDIAKKTFRTALTLDGVNMSEEEVGNNPEAIKLYFQILEEKFRFRHDQLIVCLEHTGIYCLPVLDYLTKNKIKVCLEPALQIKQSQGMTRGKSDRVDARRIAQYAYKNHHGLRFWKPQRPSIQKLKALLVLRERLVKIKGQLEKPVKETRGYMDDSIRKTVLKGCKSSMNALARDINKTEKEIHLLVEKDSHIKEQFQSAISVPGIGKITALNIIVFTGEFQQISEAKKFACYAGVAPFEHTSGSSIRGRTRTSKIANMTVKRLLHMAVMSSIQCCNEMKAFYERKVTAGKNKMSVLNAVRNKLISRVFSCVKGKRLYEKDYRNALA